MISTQAEAEMSAQSIIAGRPPVFSETKRGEDSPEGASRAGAHNRYKRKPRRDAAAECDSGYERQMTR
jgi:hypothetical protein